MMAISTELGIASANQNSSQYQTWHQRQPPVHNPTLDSLCKSTTVVHYLIMQQPQSGCGHKTLPRRSASSVPSCDWMSTAFVPSVMYPGAKTADMVDWNPPTVQCCFSTPHDSSQLLSGRSRPSLVWKRHCTGSSLTFMFFLQWIRQTYSGNSQ
jgi:hypothetical protein